MVTPSSWLVGHKHDVLTVDYWPPNTLVTGSYDGVVMLWNLVSGHNMLRLVPPEFDVAGGGLSAGQKLGQEAKRLSRLIMREAGKGAARPLTRSWPQDC